MDIEKANQENALRHAQADADSSDREIADLQAKLQQADTWHKMWRRHSVAVEIKLQQAQEEREKWLKALRAKVKELQRALMRVEAAERDAAEQRALASKYEIALMLVTAVDSLLKAQDVARQALNPIPAKDLQRKAPAEAQSGGQEEGLQVTRWPMSEEQAGFHERCVEAQEEGD